MLLLLGPLVQERGDALRLLQLAELDERLDELRCDRKGAGVVDPLATGVLPDQPEALGRGSGVAGAEGCDSASPQASRRSHRPSVVSVAAIAACREALRLIGEAADAASTARRRDSWALVPTAVAWDEWSISLRRLDAAR